MKIFLLLLMFSVMFFSCDKTTVTPIGCDMQQAYLDNVKKLTIPNGIWGTVASTEGNCMPMVGATHSSCMTCTVQRTIKIYPYTLFSNATQSGYSGGFYDSFNSPLIAEVAPDANGFYQISIPPGHYSIAIVENGKLYANVLDGQGGINPVNYTGGLLNFNLGMNYKVVY